VKTYVGEAKEGRDGALLRLHPARKEPGGLALAYVLVEPVRADWTRHNLQAMTQSIDYRVEGIDSEDEERADGQHQRLGLVDRVGPMLRSDVRAWCTYRCKFSGGMNCAGSAAGSAAAEVCASTAQRAASATRRAAKRGDPHPGPPTQPDSLSSSLPPRTRRAVYDIS
jgi:hypothetical protein